MHYIPTWNLLINSTIFLSTYYQPGIVLLLDPGTILNLQYSQTCKVICGKLLILECHLGKGTSEVTKSNAVSLEMRELRLTQTCYE